jgi:hypothetical protein
MRIFVKNKKPLSKQANNRNRRSLTPPKKRGAFYDGNDSSASSCTQDPEACT